MKLNFISGFIGGAMLFGTAGAIAAGIIANPNPFPVKLNGNDVSIEGYNINGSTYFKLRDVANAVGIFGVDFNNNTIQLSKDGYVYDNTAHKNQLKFTDEINRFFTEKGIRIIEFEPQDVGTDEFIYNFIFDYYTGTGDINGDMYYRGGYDSNGNYRNGGFRWNENIVKSQYKLFFGEDMPDYFPHEEMVNYNNGFYEVGASDYGEEYYKLTDFNEIGDKLELYYAINDWEGNTMSYAVFELQYADNQNGYIIKSKKIIKNNT